ncbi:MAG: PKD domain-containing protein [Bacteroidota bacterium]|nr:PKD domain-containing protein [Bacteroidota bacterium]
MKKTTTPLVFLFVFLFFQIGFSQSKSVVKQISENTHNHEKDLEEILPFEKYFSIISSIENANGIYGEEKNYFFRYINNEIRSLRKLAIEAHKAKKENNKILLTDFEKIILAKAKSFADNKTQIIDQIQNPLKYSGYNFRIPNPHDEINTPGVACTNEGFESGNLNAWAGSYEDQSVCTGGTFLGLCLGYSANDPYSVNGFNQGANNATSPRHTLCTPGADPNIPALQRVRPGGGNFSIRINNTEYSDYSAARLIQTFRVTPANVNFTYYYAVVLEDGGAGHTVADQPYFTIRMYDQFGAVINCATFDVNGSNAAGIGNFITSGTFTYRDWSAVFVPLQAYVGQDVTIEFITNDCTQGGHLGYAYIDADCQPFQLISQAPLICNGLNNILTAPAGAATYTWTTAGGNIVSGGNTNAATVNAAGSYSVTMTAFGSGCSYTIDTVLNAAPVSPNADFTSNSPCVGGTTVFTDQSTGGITSWNWDFGDGNTDVAQSPNHVYATAGTYTVTLQATNGCIDTYSTTVTVPASSTAAFTAAPVCEGAATSFVNTSVAPAGSTFDWVFGDTQTASNTGGNVSHLYSAANTYNVTLNITAPGGCNGTVTQAITVNANPVPAFTANSVCLTSCTQFTNTTPAAPAITTWSWDFTNNASGDDATAAPCFTYPTAGTFTASLTATTAGSCVGTYTTTVTVNPNPVASFTASTECVGTATQFDNGTSTIAAPDNIAFYNWTFGDGLNASGANTTHTYATCGTYTSNLVLVSNNNCTSTSSYTVTVKCSPTVTVPTNTVVCPATAIAATNFVSNPVGATFGWANSETLIGLGGSGSNDIPAFNTTNTGSTQLDGTISVTPTLNGCIGTPSTYTISVKPTPVMDPVSSATYCPGNAVAAANFTTIPTGSTFAWTNTDATIGLAVSGATPYSGFNATNIGSTTLTGIISVTPTLASCVGLPINYSITVNPTPVVTVPATATYCPNDLVPASNFTSVPAGASFAWTNSDATIGITSTSPGQITAFNAVNTSSFVHNGTIIVTPTLNNCPGLPVTYTITVKPTPYVNAISDELVCPATNIAANNFSSTPANATMNWTQTNMNVGLATASGINSVPAFTSTNASSVNEVSTITITPTLNGCIGPDSTYTVTVKPTPVLLPILNDSLCPAVTNVAASNFTTVPTGSTINWLNDNTSIGLSANGIDNYTSFTPINNGSTNQVATITATPTLNGCIGLAQSYFIKVFPKPIAVVPANSEACPGATVNSIVFSSIPTDPATTFSWAHSNANVGLSQGSASIVNSSSTNSFTATNTNSVDISSVFTVSTSLNGCLSTPVNYTFTTNPLPTPIFASSHTCEGDPTNFASSSSVGTGSITTHQWDFDNNGTYEISGTDASPTYTLLTPGTHSIHLNTITDKGCNDDIVLPLYIYPKPIPTISVDEPNGCADHDVVLSAGVVASSTDHNNSILTWEWDIQTNGVNDFTTTTSGSIVDTIQFTYENSSAVQSQFYQVTVTATTDDGCIGSYSSTPTFIEVYANPIADFTYNTDPEPDVQNPLVQFIDQSQGASNWAWEFNDPYSSAGANASTFQNPQHYYENYQATSYDVTLVVDNGQCWDTITKPVTIKPEWTFYIPNAFSPNDDGFNDGFRGTGVGIKEYSLSIYDRWGELIWTSGDLEEYWNGSVNSRTVQEDVYVWKVKLKDGKGFKHALEGTVSVVR